MSEGKKFDGDKVRMELLSTEALRQIAMVMTFGAKKYDSHNWRKGLEWSRVLGALLRHTTAFLNGEDKDPETGLSHMAHAGCCVMFLLEYEKTNKQFDDRYITEHTILEQLEIETRHLPPNPVDEECAKVEARIAERNASFVRWTAP